MYILLAHSWLLSPASIYQHPATHVYTLAHSFCLTYFLSSRSFIIYYLQFIFNIFTVPPVVLCRFIVSPQNMTITLNLRRTDATLYLQNIYGYISVCNIYPSGDLGQLSLKPAPAMLGAVYSDHGEHDQVVRMCLCQRIKISEMSFKNQFSILVAIRAVIWGSCP